MAAVKLLLLAGGVLALSLMGYYIMSGTRAAESRVAIRAPLGAVDAHIANTQGEREKGLSGRPGLHASEGLLFIFDNDGAWGIWMKDMLFPIDIIWMDSSHRVVTVSRGVEPASYREGKVFYPESPSRYVLEVASGTAERLGIQKGDVLEW